MDDDEELMEVGGWASPGHDAVAFQAGIDEIEASFATPSPKIDKDHQSKQARPALDVAGDMAGDELQTDATVYQDEGLNDEWMAEAMMMIDAEQSQHNVENTPNVLLDSGRKLEAAGALVMFAGADNSKQGARELAQSELQRTMEESMTLGHTDVGRQEGDGCADHGELCFDGNRLIEQDATAQQTQQQPAISTVQRELGRSFPTALTLLQDPSSQSMLATSSPSSSDFRSISTVGRKSLLVEMRIEDKEAADSSSAPASRSPQATHFEDLTNRTKRRLFDSEGASTSMPETGPAHSSEFLELTFNTAKLVSPNRSLSMATEETAAVISGDSGHEDVDDPAHSLANIVEDSSDRHVINRNGAETQEKLDRNLSPNYLQEPFKKRHKTDQSRPEARVVLASGGTMQSQDNQLPQKRKGERGRAHSTAPGPAVMRKQPTRKAKAQDLGTTRSPTLPPLDGPRIDREILDQGAASNISQDDSTLTSLESILTSGTGISQRLQSRQICSDGEFQDHEHGTLSETSPPVLEEPAQAKTLRVVGRPPRERSRPNSTKDKTMESGVMMNQSVPAPLIQAPKRHATRAKTAGMADKKSTQDRASGSAKVTKASQGSNATAFTTEDGGEEIGEKGTLKRRKIESTTNTQPAVRPRELRELARGQPSKELGSVGKTRAQKQAAANAKPR